MKKRLIALVLLATLLLSGVVPVSSAVATNTDDIKSKMDSYAAFLKNRGSSCWNANLRSSDAETKLKNAVDKGDLTYGLTNSACSYKGSHEHKNGCESNIFGGAAQCHGFAKYLAYYLFGSYPTQAGGKSILSGYTEDTKWAYYDKNKGPSSCPDLQPGDFVRYNRGSAWHTVIVHYIKGDTVYVIDCNHSGISGGACRISSTANDGTKWLHLYVSDITNAYKNGKAYVCRYTGATTSKPTSVSVRTESATNITESSAQLNGTLSANRSVHITEHGAYLGTDTSNMKLVAKDVVERNKSSLTMFYNTVKYGCDLQPNTTYYYFQYVVADGDMIKGNTVSFKTLPDSRNIKVTTNPATEITETSAQLNGTFSANATVHITEHGAYLGTSPESMTAVAVDNVDYNKSSLTMFYRTSKYCDGLVQPGTTYYFRQYVIADGTTYWGDVLTFTTPGKQSTTPPSEQPPQPPVAPYLHVSANTITEGESVTIWWDAVPNSTEYGLTLSYGSGGTIMPMIKETRVELTNLAPGTYSAEGHASGEGGISPSSNVVTFTVNPKAQQAQHHVYTNPATNITSTSAQLNGSFSSDSTPHMTEHGAYLGTNSGNMQKVAVDKVNYYKSSLTMFYSTSKYYGSLAPNTTYYFCQYAIIDGVEYRGNTLSFTTSKNTTTGVIKGTNGHLAINSKPSAGNQIGRIPEGATCEVDLSRTSGNWYWVTYNGVSGYAYKKYIILN